MESAPKRSLLVSNGWMQAVMIVLLLGFFVLGFLAYRTYTDEPPIPSRVQASDGHVLFSHDDILSGQGTFLRNGLMEYGSIFGHGAYLGPDYTADYLHRAALLVRQHYAGQGSDRSAAQAVVDFKTNRYDPTSGVLTFTDAQAAAFNELTNYYSRIFAEPSSKYGLRPQAIADPTTVGNSRRSLPGRHGRRPRYGQGNHSRTRTTGRRRAWSIMAPPPICWCGAFSHSSLCSVELG